MTRRLTGFGLFATASLFSVWSLALVWLNRDTWVGDPGEAFGLPIGALAFATVGLVISRSRSENPVGWIMLVLSLALVLMTWGFEYALRDYTGHELAFAAPAAYVSNSARTLVLGALAALALLFPSGKLRTRTWWVMIWGVVLGTALTLALSLFVETAPMRLVDAGLTGEPQEVVLAPPLIPGVIEGGVADNLGWGLGLVFLFVPLGAALVRLVVDFVRGDAVERQQLKWVVYVLVVGFSFMGMSQIPLSMSSRLNQVGGLVILVGVPVAMGIAITRYRLYDIDRIVSRTVTYASVVGLLALVFAAGVVLVPNALPGMEDEPVLVAISTLVAAALFNPLRQRVQRVVDRRFNRSRYSAERVVEDFMGTLQDRVDPDGVADGWIGVVSETMQPAGIAVWVRPPA